MASYDASTLIGMYTAGQDRRNAEIDRRYALEDRARKIKAEEERKALLKDLFTGGGQSASAQPATSTPSLQTQFVGAPSAPVAPVEPAPEQKTIGTDQGEVLIPTVSDDGRILSDQEAVQQYRRTGKHLGIFNTPDEATAYAKSLHNQQAEMYAGQGGPEESMLPPANDTPAPRLNQQTLAKLLVVDPETATNIINAFSKMDEAGRKSLDDKFNAMGSVAARLSTLPLGQRAMEFRRAVQYLRAKGWTDQELQNANLSDQGLQTYAREVVDVKTLMQEARQSASDTETARHNRVSEGQTAERNQLSRDRESRLKKWGPQPIIVGGMRTDTSDLDY